MPSNAYKNLRYNLVDVERVIQAHDELSGDGSGRRALGHITRSGVLFLCACWEIYVEELLLEAARFLAAKCSSPHELPLAVQKQLSALVKEAKHELKPLDLAGSGWRQVYESYAAEAAAGLNTPKSAVLDKLYLSYVGLAHLSALWSLGASTLDGFVTARGEIAHRARRLTYVRIQNLKSYVAEVRRTAWETDNGTCLHLKAVSPEGRQPWVRIPPS